MQLQMVFEERSEHAVSPFDKAMAALQRGDESKARKIATNGLRRPGAGLPVPQTIDADGLHRLLAVLPRPLPYGDPWNEYVLTNLLVSTAEYREAATYGAESFARQPQLLLAATIARAAGGARRRGHGRRLAAGRRRHGGVDARAGRGHRPGARAGRRPRPLRRRRPARLVAADGLIRPGRRPGPRPDRPCASRDREPGSRRRS